MLDPPEKRFRFLALPYEIRNQIYSILLCTHPPADPRPSHRLQLDLRPFRAEEGSMKTSIGAGMNILLANRQVHAEAMDTLIRGNLFVRIVVKGVKFVKLVLEKHHFPVVPLGIAEFSGHIMTYMIDWDKRSDPLCGTTHSVLILRRDLDLFLSLIVRTGYRRIPCFAQCTRHTVTIHDPFKMTLSPDYLDWESRNHEHRLEPYRRKFRGFTNISFKGNISPSMARSLEGEIAQQEPAPDCWKTLREFRNLKDKGDTSFEAGDVLSSAEAYRTAIDGIRTLRMVQTWAALASSGGSEFVATMAELYWSLHLAQLLNMTEYLQDLQLHRGSHKDAVEQIEYVYGRAIDILMCANQMHHWFDTTIWRPDQPQVGKLYYRTAVVCRMCGETARARRLIKTAISSSPMDPLIRSEAARIESHDGAGAGHPT